MVEINELLGKRTTLALLVLFVSAPSQEFTRREIQEKTALSKVTVIRTLNFLGRNQLIMVAKKGNLNLYTLNTRNIIIFQIKRLHTLLQLQGLSTIAKKHHCDAYLYGSAARGEDVEASDIDILIIGKVDKGMLLKDTEHVAKKIKKEIRIQAFTQQEWSQLSRKDPAFYQRVEKDKVLLS